MATAQLDDIQDCRALPIAFGGNDDPSCILRTRVREVRFCKVSGRAPSAVFSRCKDVNWVKTPKLVGNEPATGRRVNISSGKRSPQFIPGEFPFPTIVSDSRSVRFVNCAGRDAGIAGKDSCLQAKGLR